MVVLGLMACRGIEPRSGGLSATPTSHWSVLWSNAPLLGVARPVRCQRAASIFRVAVCLLPSDPSYCLSCFLSRRSSMPPSVSCRLAEHSADRVPQSCVLASCLEASTYVLAHMLGGLASCTKAGKVRGIRHGVGDVCRVQSDPSPDPSSATTRTGCGLQLGGDVCDAFVCHVSVL